MMSFTNIQNMQTQITKTYQRTAARRAISKNPANNKKGQNI